MTEREHTLRKTSKGYSVRLRMGSKQRPWLPIASRNERDALARKEKLEALARMLVRADRADEAPVFLRDAALAPTAEAFARIERTARYVCAQPKATRAELGARLVTFRDVAEYWLSGELERDYPDTRHKGERSRESSRGLMRALYPLIGHVPVAEFTIEHAEAAKKALPKRSGPPQRRNYCIHIRAVLARAVYPLRLIEHNPVPSQFIPKAPKRREFGFLYPDEDRLLLACELIDWWERLLYGLLDREGCRVSEAQAATWGDADLARGVFVLDKNKTRAPRSWKLQPDVVRALEAWKERLGPATESDPIFPALDIAHIARRFREQLVAAGVTRRELHRKTDERRPIRVHDLRSTFVTLSLAAGKTETWVMDRTGHTTSLQLNQYRRLARFAEELELGPLGPLDVLLGVIPEAPAETAPTARIMQHVAPPRVAQKVAHAARFEPETAAGRTCSCSPQSGGCEHERAISATSGSADPPRKRRGPPQKGGVAHEVAQGGPRPPGPVDAVESALSTALERASAAGEWEAVTALARELGERRRARETSGSNVASLAAARAKREGK
jgi:integrase